MFKKQTGIISNTRLAEICFILTAQAIESWRNIVEADIERTEYADPLGTDTVVVLRSGQFVTWNGNKETWEHHGRRIIDLETTKKRLVSQAG